MKQFKNISIRKKILLSMLVFTLTPIILVSTVAVRTTYKTMRNQLIYDYRMSSGWLQDRLTLETNAIMKLFYNFEVNRDIKNYIVQWCANEESLNYSTQWELITLMNTVISMDSRINSIEIHNLTGESVLIAERSGAHIDTRSDQLDKWIMRDESLQNNLVFLREKNELLACHQINRFDDKYPIAIVIIRFRPYHLQNILDEIKTVPEETILVFNDQNEVIEADYGTAWDMDSGTMESIRNDFSLNEEQEGSYNDHFWFYRSVSNGKIQILLTVPNKTIVNALIPTILGSVLVAAAAVCASIVCSIIYSNTVSRPIRKLSSEMKDATLNEYAGSTLEIREDEIGVLQDSFNQMVLRNKELIAQQYQSKIEERNAQIRALQAQINPHFMYNTLQLIGGMALEKNTPEIYAITLALSDILHYCLRFSKEMIFLEEEITYLQSYVKIQNERFNGRVQLKLNINPETRRCLIPKLILQPLAENSFEHGLPEKEGLWVIEIESNITQEGDLLILVKDNGIGLGEKKLNEIQKIISQNTEQVLKAESHIGLTNVNARIRLRSQNEKHGITILSSQTNGTTIQVLMPVAHEGDENSCQEKL